MAPITDFSSKLPIKSVFDDEWIVFLFVTSHFHTGFKPQITVTEKKKKEIKKEIKKWSI